MNAHEVKLVRLIQSLCAVCGSNLAGLTLLYIVLPCVAAVVSRPAWRMLALLIARYVSNLIKEHYYYNYYYYFESLSMASWTSHIGMNAYTWQSSAYWCRVTPCLTTTSCNSVVYSTKSSGPRTDPLWYVNFRMSHRLPQRRRGRRRCADSCSAATAFLWLWDTAVFDPTSRKPLNRFYCNLKLRRTPEDYTSKRIWFRSDDVGRLGEYPVCHCRVSFFAILVASSRAQVVPVTNCDELL